jgi:hypothetical protein
VAAQFPKKGIQTWNFFVALWRDYSLVVVLFGSQTPSPCHSSLSLRRSFFFVAGGGGLELNQTTAKKRDILLSCAMLVSKNIHVVR